MVDALPELAPLAEQERPKVLLPPTPMVIDSDPEVAFEPDQDPEAEQLVASVDDQVRVIEEFTSVESADAERVTVILGVGATGAELPPPPPPPQLKIKNTAKRVKRFLIYSIYMKRDYVQKKDYLLLFIYLRMGLKGTILKF